jgi:MFS family permease
VNLTKLKNEFSFIQGNLLINTITLTLILVTAAIPYTYYSKFVEGLGGSPSIVGVIGLLSHATLALVQIPGGYLADKHGRRQITIIMTFAISGTYFLFAIAPNWQFFMISVILQNIFHIYQPALQALVADSTPPDKRGLGFSIINLLHYVSVPSPIIAGILATQFGLIPGMRIGYLIVTVAFILAGILRMRFKETLKKAIAENLLVGVIRNFPKSIIECARTLKASSASMMFLFISFAIYHFAWFMCSLNLIFYATDIMNMTELEWAALMTLFSLVNVLAALPCGKIVDRFGRKKPLILAWILFIPGLFGFVYGNILLTSTSLLFLGVALILANSAYPALMSDLVARNGRGKLIGSTNFFFNILSGLGQLSGGFIYQYLSPSFPFLIAAILFVPCLFLTLFQVQEPTKREL